MTSSPLPLCSRRAPHPAPERVHAGAPARARTRVPPGRPVRVVVGLLSFLWFLIFLVGLSASPASAQPTAGAGDLAVLFETAQENYRQGAFDEAAEQFATVAASTPYREVRREALRYLGRTHIVRNDPERAKTAMEKLLQLEPPRIALDPDVEPPPIMNVYYEARRELSDSFCWTGEEQPDGTCTTDDDTQTLAVIDFSNNSIDARERFEGLQWGLPTMFIQHLNGATNLNLIERERLQWLQQEIDLADQGYMDPATAARAGRLLGATNVLLGSFMIFDGQITIWSRLVETETGKILLGRQIRGDTDDFHALTRDLSEAMAEAMETPFPSGDARPGGPSRSLDAMLAYSDALKFIEDGAYDRAVRKLEEAIGHDPNYTPAVRRLESLRPMLLAASPTDEATNE